VLQTIWSDRVKRVDALIQGGGGGGEIFRRASRVERKLRWVIRTVWRAKIRGPFLSKKEKL